jgi:hypothetical protein
MSERVLAWVQRYERAWRTDGTEKLDELFRQDALYFPQPFADPLRGLAAISKFWEAERESPDESFSMAVEVIADQGQRGVARLEVVYGDPPTRRYRDLWIITFDADDRAAVFEEWPFFPGQPRVAPAGAV